jgi:cyanophycinase
LCIDNNKELTLGFAKVNKLKETFSMKDLSLFFLILNTKKKRIAVIIVYIYSILSCSYSYSTESKTTHFELMLAGGGLATCSSMATKNCTENHFGPDDKFENLYQFSEKNADKFRNTAVFLALSASQKMQINLVIQHIYAKNPDVIANLQGLREHFAQSGHLSLYQNMDDALYYAFLDSFEYSQTDQKGGRKKERVDLTNNKNQSSLRIYRRFVQQAALRMPEERSVPKIAVITASARDPFEAADFYISVFEQAGAEVIWLPLDGVYQQARQLAVKGELGCAMLDKLRAKNNRFYRDDIYPKRTAKQRQFCDAPELMLQALSEVQGVFFNGGDQSLTLSALRFADGLDSPELTLIKQQVKLGKLIVGGTSAGTAVQSGGVFGQIPIPMITNGDPEFAMSRGAFSMAPPSQRCPVNSDCSPGVLGGDLTYKMDGGTGLFNLGLLDTHFSERDRETRLALFTAVTNQRFGFGVDEATALFVGYSRDRKEAVLEIMGQHGVFIVDRTSSRYSRATQNEKLTVEITSLSHYLTDGSVAHLNLDNMNWRFMAKGQTLNSLKPGFALGRGHWRDQVRAYCGSKEPIIWQQFGNEYFLQPTDNTVFSYNDEADHCSYSHLPFTIIYRQ